MRTLRIARPAQQALAGGSPAPHREVWAGLPETARRRALTLLARMIARGVLDTGMPGEES
ncbi:MAG TPA: hypothetical protein VG123_22175 [Streptosporangiaceae bacterium]|nr:hypothetical protein [Streptosporangiaceae bacterium]